MSSGAKAQEYFIFQVSTTSRTQPRTKSVISVGQRYAARCQTYGPLNARASREDKAQQAA